ncbi:MAG TPA: paraquat-inducible protein B [Acetobacteraceae bacterium]|jgi:paraquat-inducible protein B|nr:paraquat-inducible protein B [Acetobacteraceae bacterium]
MNDKPPTAVVRSHVDNKRRLSLIWAIPLITALIGGWLAWKTLSERGPLITITFETAEGLQPNQSHVRHKDVDMGVVQKVGLTPDLKRVQVTVRMNREAESLLTDKAQFWVVRPRFFAGSISGLQTLFSGSYIDLLPAAKGGEEKRDFVGLENPPVLQSDVPGRTFLLKADRIGSLNLGSPIMFRDLEVGEVLGWDVGEMARSITIHAFVREPFDKYVHDNSRFWNASGIKFGIGGEGLQVHLESLRAVVLGGIAFETPDDPAFTTESTQNHAFSLFRSEDAADSSTYKRSVPFIANFNASVAGLNAGAAVTVRGLKIGEVTSVSLVYDRTLDNVVVPVHFTLEPERIALLDLPTDGDLDTRMADLVQRGLRVKLETANVLTGQKQLAMDIYHDLPAAKVAKEGDAYVIPVLGGSTDDVATAATNLVNRLNDIPFASIGKNLDQTLAGVNALVNDKQLGQSVTALRSTLASTQALVENLNHGVSSLTPRLPGMAANLETSVQNTNKLIASLESTYGGDSRFSRDVGRMMSQLSDAARSIRVLADLLSRHPEALIRGRTDQGVQ